MSHDSIEFSIFLIFSGAAVMATLALYARQAMIVGYIILGLLLGPWGFSFIHEPEQISDISNIGIVFLLFLLGLDLLPQQLLKMLREAMIVTLVSSTVFMSSSVFIAYMFGFAVLQALLIGIVFMFSSTIIGLKLLPTTTLHHKHTGRIIISVLLIQDVIAIIVLLLLQGYGKGGDLIVDIMMQLLSLPLLIAICYVLNKYIMERLLMRFDQIHEYIFLLAIAWCLGIAELATVMGLSHEIGAFIAGVTLASSPIALFITNNLKPLRDFFLVIFFFSLGAGFNINVAAGIFLPSIVLAMGVIIFKPIIFFLCLKYNGENSAIAWQVGFRLGQVSEFSLLIAVLALESGFIDQQTSYLIQLTTLLTFMISSFIIVQRYPTPVSANTKLHRD